MVIKENDIIAALEQAHVFSKVERDRAALRRSVIIELLCLVTCNHWAELEQLTGSIPDFKMVK